MLIEGQRNASEPWNALDHSLRDSKLECIRKATPLKGLQAAAFDHFPPSWRWLKFDNLNFADNSKIIYILRQRAAVIRRACFGLQSLESLLMIAGLIRVWIRKFIVWNSYDEVNFIFWISGKVQFIPLQADWKLLKLNLRHHQTFWIESRHSPSTSHLYSLFRFSFAPTGFSILFHCIHYLPSIKPLQSYRVTLAVATSWGIDYISDQILHRSGLDLVDSSLPIGIPNLWVERLD